MKSVIALTCGLYFSACAFSHAASVDTRHSQRAATHQPQTHMRPAHAMGKPWRHRSRRQFIWSTPVDHQDVRLLRVPRPLTDFEASDAPYRLFSPGFLVRPPVSIYYGPADFRGVLFETAYDCAAFKRSEGYVGRCVTE
jgi:hypothetical protein